MKSTSHCVFLLLLCLHGCLSQEIVTYASKVNEKLPCGYQSGSSTITWAEVTGGGNELIFQYIPAIPQVDDNRADAKYDNFNYIITPTSFDLLIENVDKDDGGIYQCTVSGTGAGSTNTILNVEVLPDPLSLTCYPTPACPLPNDGSALVKCTCKAIGFRPATLELIWTGANAAVTKYVKSTGSDDLTNLISEATFKPTSNDNEVVCTIIGYRADDIPEANISLTYIF